MHENNMKPTLRSHFLISPRKLGPLLSPKPCIDRSKVASDLGFYGSPKDTSHVQLATFSEEKPAQGEHEAMLRRELTRFRGEIEQKFKLSHMNKAYSFPKPGFDDDEKEYENSAVVNSNFCVL